MRLLWLPAEAAAPPRPPQLRLLPAGDVANDPAVTLVYAEVNPLDTTVVGQVATHFAERVHELSGGSVTIDVQGGGVLGAEGDFLDNMVGGVGTIDMARLSVSTLTGYGVPKSTLLCLPFTFVSRDHFWNFAASDLAQEFLDEPFEAGIGLHGLFLGEEGFRHIFTNKPVSGLADLQGMKIRVSTDPTMVGMIEDHRRCMAEADPRTAGLHQAGCPGVPGIQQGTVREGRRGYSERAGRPDHRC